MRLCAVALDRLPPPPEGVEQVHCCICLNLGKRVEAITSIRGYMICEEHVELVQNRDFNFLSIMQAARKTGV